MSYEPASLTLTVLSTSSIKLDWDISAYYPEYVWYQWVSRSLDGTNWGAVAKLNSDISSHTDTGLSSGTLYYYRISSWGYSDDLLGESNTASATTATSVTLTAPSGITTIPYQGTKVEINFTNNSVGEDYHCIERDTVEITQLPTGTTYYLDTGLTAGTTYTYRIRDKHDTDYSSYSSNSTATPPKPFTHIAYGTGTTAEGIALTTLTTEVARVAASISIVSTYTPNDTVRFTHEFTAASGITVTEVAVFDAAAGGNMLGRKLINSGTGVAVAEGDLFRVTYDAIVKDGGCGN